MSVRDLKILVLPALLAGTSRHQIDFARALGGAISPDDKKSDLKALALTGQALRFERPPPPSSYAAIEARTPSRRSVPEALRPALVRMFGDGKAAIDQDSDLALGLALALERLRLQPHPFDFPRMDAFVRAHAERLGPDACAWADRKKAVAEKRFYFDAEVLDDSNWHEATPTRAHGYIEERRRRDADAARALVEAVWSTMGADLRLRILQALRSGLSPADTSFLEGLAKDRAPRVRELAERYLSHLSGTPGQSAAVKSVMQRIIRGQSGLLRKRPSLKLELPATQTGNEAWVLREFADVELDELGDALGLQIEEMIAAAAKDRNLSLAMAYMAFRQGDLAIARQAYESLSEISPYLGHQLLESIQGLDANSRRELTTFLLRKLLAAGTLFPLQLGLVLRSMQGPLSTSLMDEVLRSPIWAKWNAAPEAQHSAIYAGLAALCPSERRPALRAALAPFDPAHTMASLQYLDILDTLEKVAAHE